MTRPPAFEIVTREDAGTVEVELRGELDIATAPELDAELARIRALPGLERVVVDLRNLLFLDSTGLEVIVKLDAAAARDGFDVAVVRGPRAVERLFAVMQLDRKLRIVDDPAELARRR
jgi:anti-anti-sigma factor